MKIIYLGSEVGFRALDNELAGQATVEHVKATQEAVSNALTEADAILDASMKVRITNDMVKKAKNLKIISCATTGSDHIEREELERRAIPVRTLKEDRDLLLNLTPAAELSWALLMACVRKLPSAFDHVKSGHWDREQFPGIMLRGKSTGIIGCGRLGSWVGRYALAFGMDVLGYDPYIDSLPHGFTRVTLEELVRTSDFVSVHVHLSEETMGLISRKYFKMMKPGVIFINTSRGAVIDEKALLEGLVSGRVGAAGLDVLEGEPDIHQNPLVDYSRSHDNLIITPHCGGFSPDAVELVCAHAAKKIITELGLNS